MRVAQCVIVAADHPVRLRAVLLPELQIFARGHVHAGHLSAVHHEDAQARIDEWNGRRNAGGTASDYDDIVLRRVRVRHVASSAPATAKAAPPTAARAETPLEASPKTCRWRSAARLRAAAMQETEAHQWVSLQPAPWQRR